MALSLLIEHARGRDSKWFAYIAMLPDTPALFSLSWDQNFAREVLEGTAISVGVLTGLQVLQRLVDTIMEALEHPYRDRCTR